MLRASLRGMIYETRREGQTEDERLAERFARRETEPQRQARIGRKRIDAATANAIKIAFKTR